MRIVKTLLSLVCGLWLSGCSLTYDGSRDPNSIWNSVPGHNLLSAAGISHYPQTVIKIVNSRNSGGSICVQGPGIRGTKCLDTKPGPSSTLELAFAGTSYPNGYRSGRTRVSYTVWAAEKEGHTVEMQVALTSGGRFTATLHVEDEDLN